MARFRTSMLLVAVGLGLPVLVLEFALGHDWPLKSAWLLSVGLVAIWLRLHPPSKTQRVVVAAVMAALGPLAVGLEQRSFVELATIGVMPLVGAVIFIRALDVVVAITLAGWAANTLLFSSLGWPATDVASVSIRLALGSAAMVLASAGWRRQRKLDLANEARQNLALRRSENRRAQAERLAIVGRLAAGVAHEINNPISFVKANVNVLERHFTGVEKLPDTEVQEVFGETREGIERVSQIISDLKTYSREGPEHLEEVEVGPLVRQTVRLASVRLPPSTAVTVDFPDVLPSVKASQRKLAQVLLNLLINAGDALEEARTPSPTISVALKVEGQELKLSVRDNGPGLSSQAMARLFEPFFTTKAPGKGTGLGLALSREYMESFKGTLSGENASPTGAIFTLTLPLSATPEPPSRP